MGRNKSKGGGGKPDARGSRDQRNLDVYLEKKQLERKHIAKDGSCLFRAVAEQVFVTQFYHHKVRMQCVSYIRAHQDDFQNFFTEPFEEYLTRLAKELWGGEVELVALSKLYCRSIIVYMCNEQNGVSEQVFRGDETASEKQNSPIQLAYSDGNHYDSVYSTQYMRNMGLCQGIVYRLLFEGVFEDSIPNICKRRLQTFSENDAELLEREAPSQNDKPLSLLDRHYSVDELKAMGSQMYLNAALLAHHNERDSIEKLDRHVAISIQFQVGDKCRFRLPGGKAQDGEIIALNGSEGCHTVFVFDANEEWEIPSKDISLKHTYNGRRNPSHQNRSKNRHHSSTDNAYNLHDNHSSPSPVPPPSSNHEAWPTPTYQGQTSPDKTNSSESKTASGTIKRVQTAQSQTTDSRKGGREENKHPSQKGPPLLPSPRQQLGTSTSSSPAASKGNPSQARNQKNPTSSKNSRVPEIKSNTTTVPNRMTPKSSSMPSIVKPSGSNVPGGKVSTLPTQPNRPVSAKKVDGGPGGSLTSEDSNYSNTSSSDESTGKGDQANPEPSPALPKMFTMIPTRSPQSSQHPGTTRQTNKQTAPTPQYNGQPRIAPNNAEAKLSGKGNWQGASPMGVVSQAPKQAHPLTDAEKNKALSNKSGVNPVKTADRMSVNVPPAPVIRPGSHAKPINVMTTFGNGIPPKQYVPSNMDAQREDRGRESPYLTPQIPRDPSSQPEDDWPIIDDQKMRPPDPSGSTLLAAMGSRNLQNMASFNVPNNPSIISSSSGVTKFPPSTISTASGNHLPVGPFSPPPFSFIRTDSGPKLVGMQAVQSTAMNSHTPPCIAVPHGSVLRTVSSNVGPTRVYPLVPLTTQVYARHIMDQNVISPPPTKTSFDQETTPHQPPARTESHQQQVPSPNVRVPITPNTSLTSPVIEPHTESPKQQKTFNSEAPNAAPPKSMMHAATLVKPKMCTSSTQTPAPPAPPAPPKLTDSFTQVEQTESLSMTTYTQTHIKTFKDIGVDAVISTNATSTQAVPDSVNADTQTSEKFVPLLDLQPPSLERESSVVDKIKFGIEYSIKCLEACAQESGEVINVLEDLKRFQEDELTGFLERPVPTLVPLDPSQQDFLQSFAGSREFFASQLQQLSQHSPNMDGMFFNRVGSDDMPGISGLDQQREMMQMFLHQQELIRRQEKGRPSQSGPEHPPTPQVDDVPSRQSATNEPTANQREGDVDHQIQPQQNFVPHYPGHMPPHPMMMQQPMMMMPPFFYPFPGIPMPQGMMPPYRMMQPHMVPPDHLGAVPGSHSLSSLSDSPQPNQERGERDKKSATPSPENISESLVSSHQESGIVEISSVPVEKTLVAPSALTVPLSTYQQPTAVVSSSGVRGHSNERESPATTGNVSNVTETPRNDTKQVKVPLLPLPSPFDTNNPYDTATVDSQSNPMTNDMAHTTEVTSKPDSQSSRPSDETAISRERLPCRGKPDGKPQKPSKANNQRQRSRQNPRASQVQTKETQPTSKSAPQIPTTPTRSGKPEERQSTLVKEPPTSGSSVESNKVPPPKTSSKTGRHSYQRNKGGGGVKGGSGSTRQQHKQPQSQATPSQTSQGHGGRKGGRRQGDNPSQTSSSSGRGTQDPTRGSLFENHEQPNTGIPFTAFQPRSFGGGFPSPSHLPASTYGNESEYSRPMADLSDAPKKTGSRWKFEEDTGTEFAPIKLNRDFLYWDGKDSWPNFDDPNGGNTETVEDPFQTFPDSQNHWDSDVGDFMSLTVDGLTNVDSDNLFLAPTAATTVVPRQPVNHTGYLYNDGRCVNNPYGPPAQCFSESVKTVNRVDSECVVEQTFAVKLPK